MTDNFLEAGVVWSGDAGRGHIKVGGTVHQIATKPAIGLEFEFDSIFAEPGNAFKIVGKHQFPLDAVEVADVVEWVDNQVLEVKVLAADMAGTFVGLTLKSDPSFGYETFSAPPPGGHWYWGEARGDAAEWLYVHSVDEVGKYTGNIPITDAYGNADSAPPKTTDKWNGTGWEDGRSISELRVGAVQAVHQALDELDITITGHVPIAERDSWTVKSIAASAYLAGGASTSHVAMLAAEVGFTGVTLTDLSIKILCNATAYLTVAGAISGVRQVSELAIAAATTKEELDTAVSDAEALTYGILAAATA